MWMVGGSILGSSNLRGEKSTLSPQTEHHVMDRSCGLTNQELRLSVR